MANSTEYKKKLLGRLLDFAIKIVNLAGKLPKTPAGFAIANQVVKSGTSIGANCEEAQDALSGRDFLKTMTIALKEAKETCYWLKVIQHTDLLSPELVDDLLLEINEIVAIMISSVKTLKMKQYSGSKG